MKRPSDCHPELPVHARGRCKPCHSQWYYHEVRAPRELRTRRAVHGRLLSDRGGHTKVTGLLGLGQLPPLALSEVPSYYPGMKLYPNIVQMTMTAIPDHCPKCKGPVRSDERSVSCLMCGGDWWLARIA